jgi:glycosyltransferase involved in cell wall biosynthesis
VLFEALRLLRDRGNRTVLVAPGEVHDSRRPGYFASLLTRAHELGVGGSFRSLGVLPHSHVAGLMRDAVAVINPSRFEGWSTTVEEAKSLGKRVVLSDIEVHKEQDPPGGIYFHSDDVAALADAMSLLLVERDPAEDERRAGEARQALPDRTVQFAKTYEGFVAEALGMPT